MQKKEVLHVISILQAGTELVIREGPDLQAPEQGRRDQDRRPCKS